MRSFRVAVPVLAVAAALSCLALPGRSGAADPPKHKLLFLTQSAGFEHSSIKRPSPDELSHAEKILTDIGEKAGIAVTCTKDSSLITAANLKNYDAVFFYTTGELPIPKPQDLLDYVHAGHGFIGSHCATDTFHKWESAGKKPYIDMIGAEFETHGGQEEARVEVADRKFPATAHIPGSDFRITDEWYIFKNMSPEIHPVLVLDTKSMKQELYNKRDPYPISWSRSYGKGRVFYTGLGHREDVWTNPLFQEHLIAGIRWAMGSGSK